MSIAPNFADPNQEITPDVIEAATTRLVESRVKLLFKHPFFGQLALRLKLEPADPSWCPTAATDGRKFFFNPRFVLALRGPEVVFLVAHELGHCVFEHFMRRGGRDPKLWNIAGDYIINNTLDTEIVQKAGSYAEVITTVTPFLDHKYDGWAAEEVYDDLLEQQQAGGKPEEKGQLIDVHIDMNDDGQKGDSESGDAQQGDGSDGSDGRDGRDGRSLAGRPMPMTDEECRQLQNEIKDAMIQASQSVSKDDIPSSMRGMLSDLTEPKMDWRDIIRSQIESSIKSNYTFMRPNRKGWHMSAILPGMDNDFKIDVCLAIDVSGSISQTMVQDFVSEVAGIMEEFQDYRIRIWCFDTEVSGYDEFTSDDGRDAREFEITGGGGTDFEVNWKFMKEREIEPDQFIMFTDGYPWNSWGDENYCDTVFLIHTNGRDTPPASPWGQSVYYEDDRGG